MLNQTIKNIQKVNHINNYLLEKYGKPDSKIRKKNGLIIQIDNHYILHNKGMLKNYDKYIKIVDFYNKLKIIANNQWFVGLCYYIDFSHIIAWLGTGKTVPFFL